MRKVKTYLRFFWPFLLLVLIAAVCWRYMPNSDNFRTGLISSALGIGITISFAEGLKKRDSHLRMKKTMSMLKLVAIPYLKNCADNLKETLKGYQDICALNKAVSLAVLVSNFDDISKDFDKSWLGLVYSQDSIEAINDDEFNKTANAIFELVLFTQVLAIQSINAKHMLANNISKFTDAEAVAFLEKAQQMRNDLNEAVAKLEKYTGKLDDELAVYFKRNGIKFEEFDR
jgi:hypothetical protein